MYVHVLPFYNIYPLRYFHIKTFVCLDETESYKLFYQHSFLGQTQYAYGFSTLGAEAFANFGHFRESLLLGTR